MSRHEPRFVRSFQFYFSTFSILFIILLSISINILNTCTQHRPEITFYILRQNINYTSFGQVRVYIEYNSKKIQHTRIPTHVQQLYAKSFPLICLALPYCSIPIQNKQKHNNTKCIFLNAIPLGRVPNVLLTCKHVHSEYPSWSSYMGMLLTKCCIFHETMPVHVWDAVCSNVPFDF